MSKKGQATQLQQELNTDEDWEKFIHKDGLIVVDIYAEWCGPCSAMQANLKKLKLEVGGDNLQLAIAKADKITPLARFRNKSEPTWMLIVKGKMVNLMFGANAPKLVRLIIDELKKEAAVKEGTQQRDAMEISELAPEERVRYEAEKKIQDEANRIETEKRKKDLLDRRTAVADLVLQNIHNNGVVVIFPHTKDVYKSTLSEFWEPAGVAIAATEKTILTESMLEELLYFAKTQFSEIDMISLVNEPTFSFLIKPTAGDEFTGDIDEAVLNFVYGESKCPPGDLNTPAQLLTGYLTVPKALKESIDAAEADQELGAKSRAQHRIQLTPFNKGLLRAKDFWAKQAASDDENPEEATLQITGIWAPPNANTKALAIKLLFPKIYDPIAVPEAPVIPPHVAMSYEAFKRKEVQDLMTQYAEDVVRYGFFTEDNPETAKLIAKTIPKFEKIHTSGTTYGERLIVQLSKKRKEAWDAFTDLGPTFISCNTVEGENHCKLLFPKDYDVPEGEGRGVQVKKKKKRGKKGKEAPAAQEAATVEVQQGAADAAGVEKGEHEEEHGEGEGEAEGEGEGEGEGDGESEGDGEDDGEGGMGEAGDNEDPTEADKATSPMPDEGAASGDC